MGRFIIKIKDRYFEWSTVVDAPITNGMRLGELHDYIKDEYGKRGLESLGERLQRVETSGTSCLVDDTMEETIRENHAGPNGESLTAEQIYEHYVNPPHETLPQT